MNLISQGFLLVFLPLTLIAYYGLTRTPRQKTFFLLAVSYAFYALAGWKFLPLLAGLSLATFFLAAQKRFGAGVWLNLAALVLFKYWNFGAENLNLILSLFGIRAGALHLGLPLGLSFFVFKHIGYLLDVQQKRYPAAQDFWSFALFSAYFPQISAGPISAYRETASQFETLPRRLSAEQAASGLTALSLGLAKKILIADAIAAEINPLLYSVEGFSGALPAWYLVVAYSAQLYFDFSGYTDMVLGISRLFGVEIPQNFNNPYLAKQPSEFWERWHMSLSGWFRVYLFSPLSRFFLRKWGSEKREWAQYAANVITMSLVGLWHGAGWNFILWGFYHGVYLNLGAAWKRANRALPVWLERAQLLFFVPLGWALFMGRSPAYLAHLFKNLFGLGGLGSTKQILNLFNQYSTLALFFAVLVAFSGVAEAANLEKRLRGNKAAMLALGALAALCLLLITAEAPSPFIYVEF